MLTGFLAAAAVVVIVTVALPVVTKNILIQNMAQCLQSKDIETLQEHLELARQSDARADRSIQESKKE